MFRFSILAAFLAAVAVAQAPDPLREIVDQPGLPRLLIIGDSISMGYTEPLRRKLAGTFNVHHIPENGGPTSNGVAHIDKWLGDSHWDVIVFNFGLHDLKLDEKGGHQVEIPQYEANLKLIAERLKKTGAKLIWVTTTPVPSGKLSPPRKTEDVVEYNRAAVRVLSDLRVFGWDLYFSVLTRVGELQLKENVHFTPAGYEFLAQQVKIAIPLTGVVDCCLNR